MTEILENNLKTGDPYPPRTNKNLLRVYNYQYCPYAQRALLVLTAKGIEHEIINVNLKEKPEFLLERNPLGKVPTIEFDSDDKILFESLVVADYIDEVYPGRPLRPNDPYLRAKDRVFVELISPHIAAYGKLLFSKETDLSVIVKEVKESFKKADDLLAKRRTKKFLSGDDKPGLTDYVLFPFIERIPVAIDLAFGEDSEDYLKRELPNIYDYKQALLSDSVVQKVIVKYEDLLRYTKEVRSRFAKG